MMSRFMLALLMFGGLGCAVDSGPQRTPAPDDETGENARSETERTPSPHFRLCPEFPPGEGRNLGCLSDGDCTSQGGAPIGVLCKPTGEHCCIAPD